VEVNLPEADTREVIVEEGPVITVTDTRDVFFEEELVGMEELPERLMPFLDRKDTVPVYLRADAEIPYGFVLKVMATIEREGFQNLSLVAEPEL
jgi:biopolymer transport protein TolR